jgi:hypothetical protein
MFVIANQAPGDKSPCYLLPLGTRSFGFRINEAEQFATRKEALARLRKLRDLNYTKDDPRRLNYQVAIVPPVTVL